MQEEFLHYLFEYQLIENTEFEIISPGIRNRDAGPDFSNAKIKINDTVWVGNVEIHRKASDWYAHKHHLNKAYDNIILHLVLIDDKAVKNSEGRLIPGYEIVFDSQLHQAYEQLIHSKQWIHCDDYIRNIDSFTINSMVDALSVERLKRKSQEFEQLVAYNNNDWESAFYQAICRGFGGKVNQVPFELLAKQTPYKIVLKHKDQPELIEALLLGQAGLLEDADTSNAYLESAKTSYQFLKHKYNLKPIRRELIKYHKIRPLNFPDIKLALFAQLLYNRESLLSTIAELKDIKALYSLFDVQASAFWDKHYRINTASKLQHKHLGKDAIQHIIINTIIPFLYVYANQTDRKGLAERCLEWLNQLKPEKNAITGAWEARGISNDNAFQSQGLIELKNEKCSKHQCIHCKIGHKILTLTWHG